MSLYIRKYHGQLPSLFIPSDVQLPTSLSQVTAQQILSDLVKSQSFLKVVDGQGVEVATSEEVTAALAQLKGELLNGADGAWDSFKELQTILQDDQQIVVTLSTAISEKAAQVDLDTTNSTVSSVASTLTTKADQSDLNATNAALSALEARTTEVDNTADLDKPISTATQAALDLMATQTALDTTNAALSALEARTTEVDNTADLDKPISTATQAALDLMATQTALDTTNADVATLQEKTTNMSYAGGTTTFTGMVAGLSKASVGLGNVNNTGDLAKPVSWAVQSALDLKADDSAVVKLAGAQAITGTKTVDMLNETIHHVTGVTTAVALNYNTCRGVNLLSTPTSNYSCAITNVPTSSTTATYNVTLVHSSKFFCSSVTINGVSRTLLAAGGQANITIDPSASWVVVMLSICFLNSATPVVFQHVVAHW